MRVSFLALLGGLLLLASSGCHNHCGGGCFNEPFVSSSEFDFFFEGDFFNYTSSEGYYWSTSLFDSFVSFEGLDFNGVVRVRIYDMLNFKIFDETYIGNGGFLRAKSLSNLGVPGLWEVRIDTMEVDGFVSVILD
ncbi:MAG: hypothetical protein VX764_01630 [Planctomycetota bacterium]|nr:hypothetical protein [Planctomycetota bacterium]